MAEPTTKTRAQVCKTESATAPTTPAIAMNTRILAQDPDQVIPREMRMQRGRSEVQWQDVPWRASQACKRDGPRTGAAWEPPLWRKQARKVDPPLRRERSPLPRLRGRRREDQARDSTESILGQILNEARYRGDSAEPYRTSHQADHGKDNAASQRQRYVT